jgi:hypothetical protein
MIWEQCCGDGVQKFPERRKSISYQIYRSDAFFVLFRCLLLNLRARILFEQSAKHFDTVLDVVSSAIVDLVGRMVF